MSTQQSIARSRLARTPVQAKGDIETQSLAASFMPDSWNEKDFTVDCVFYDGSTVARYDWSTGEQYDLILSMDPGACRLDRLNGGAAVCDSHNDWSVLTQLGVVRRAWIADGKCMATLQISPREELAGLRADIKAGIVRNVSMGAWVYTKNETTPKGQDRRQMTAIDWEPYEISFVSVPAVATAHVMAAETGNEVVETPVEADVEARASSPKEQMKMENQPIPTGSDARVSVTPPVVDVEALRAEGAQAERLRAEEIGQIAKILPASEREAFTASAIKANKSADQVRKDVFELLAARSEAEHQTASHAPSITRDAGETMRSGIEASLLYKFDPKAYPLKEGLGREYMGLSLLEISRECLRAKGVSMIGKNRDEVALSAITTSDMPNILANVANKTLRQGYQASPRTFTAFARQVSASDFKPINRVQLSDLPALTGLNEKGEYTRVAPSDAKETYSLATYGNVVSITRKTIINDDLNALTRIPFQMGVAAATLESNTVWNIFLSPPTMTETGRALFHATDKTKITGAGSALALAGLAAGRAQMRKQKGPKGTYLNLTPKFLLVPPDLETTAYQLIYPMGLVATTTSTVAIPAWVQSMVPVVEPRLADLATYGATAWYLAAEPTMIDTIEFCYLEGQDGVYIETRQGFDVDGFEIKARLDFAAAAIDFRGLQMNQGS